MLCAFARANVPQEVRDILSMREQQVSALQARVDDLEEQLADIKESMSRGLGLVLPPLRRTPTPTASADAARAANPPPPPPSPTAAKPNEQQQQQSFVGALWSIFQGGGDKDARQRSASPEPSSSLRSRAATAAEAEAEGQAGVVAAPALEEVAARDAEGVRAQLAAPQADAARPGQRGGSASPPPGGAPSPRAQTPGSAEPGSAAMFTWLSAAARQEAEVPEQAPTGGTVDDATASTAPKQ